MLLNDNLEFKFGHWMLKELPMIDKIYYSTAYISTQVCIFYGLHIDICEHFYVFIYR